MTVSDTLSLNYGFIGLGTMGFRMAKNIRSKISPNSKFYIYDINNAALESFKEQFEDKTIKSNIIIAVSPKEVADHVDIVLTSLPYGHHVKSVYLDASTGIIATGSTKNKLLCLDLSTIDRASSAEVCHALEKENIAVVVDAPCSGAVFGAEAGTLSFMVGSPKDIFPSVFEILKMVGRETAIFHCGGQGNGLLTKFLNNYLSAVTSIGTAEVFNIANKAGIDLNLLKSILDVSTAQNYNCTTNNPVPGLTPAAASSSGYAGGFSIELCMGVLENAVKSANDLNAKLVLSEPLLNAFRQASAIEEYKRKDYKIIYQWLSNQE